MLRQGGNDYSVYMIMYFEYLLCTSRDIAFKQLTRTAKGSQPVACKTHFKVCLLRVVCASLCKRPVQTFTTMRTTYLRYHGLHWQELSVGTYIACNIAGNCTEAHAQTGQSHGVPEPIFIHELLIQHNEC